MILFERGRAGVAALEAAAALAPPPDCELTVVVTAPQAPQPRCCGPSPQDFNCAVREEAETDIDEAARLLGDRAYGTVFRLLVEGHDPPLAKWAADREFDLALLPGRRRPFGSGRHPARRALRSVPGLTVRVVDAPRRRRSVTHG